MVGLPCTLLRLERAHRQEMKGLKQLPPKLSELKKGDRILVGTFAGPRVTMEVVGLSLTKDWAEGVLVYKKDLLRLRDAGVPYLKTDVPKKCKGVIFEHQIIKRISKRRRKK